MHVRGGYKAFPWAGLNRANVTVPGLCGNPWLAWFFSRDSRQICPMVEISSQRSLPKKARRPSDVAVASVPNAGYLYGDQSINEISNLGSAVGLIERSPSSLLIRRQPTVT